jgi:hypothetical protein
MIGGQGIRNGLLLLAGASACLLAGCGGGMPSFLGREGNAGDSFYSIRGGPPPPEPRTVPLRLAVAEPALHGVIVRVEGEAPQQGYSTAQLRPIGGGPDAAGIISFELVAVPPSAPGAIGPARTRELSAAIFVPNLVAKKLKGVRISGGGSVQTMPIRVSE